MEINDARILVAGATGVIGAELARQLAAAGARVIVAGRDASALETIATECGAPSVPLDLEDDASIQVAVTAATATYGGLDGLVIAAGVVGFGAEPSLSAADVQRLVQINFTGPVSLIRHTLDVVAPDGAIVAITAVVADQPMAGLAVYSAAKAGLSSYLTALRRERRRDKMTVVDVRPGHLDTGFETRPVAGVAPKLPAGADHREVVAATVQALRDNRREVL